MEEEIKTEEQIGFCFCCLFVFKFLNFLLGEVLQR